MDHQHVSPSREPGLAGFGLSQMSALVRLAMVLPIIALIWIMLWLLVQA